MRYFCQLLVFGIFLVPFASAGQGRFPISVDHSGEDQVGQRYAFELKEAIRGSQGMNLVQADVMPQIRVVVVTIDDSMQNKGYASAIATTILYDRYRGAPWWGSSHDSRSDLWTRRGEYMRPQSFGGDRRAGHAFSEREAHACGIRYSSGRPWPAARDGFFRVTVSQICSEIRSMPRCRRPGSADSPRGTRWSARQRQRRPRTTAISTRSELPGCGVEVHGSDRFPRSAVAEARC